MKKLLIMLMMLFTGMVNAQCDFSNVKLQQWNQGVQYKWYLSGWDYDSCKDYMFMVYTAKTKKIDTVQDIKGIVQISFNEPGEYKLYVKLWDKCNKCDTALVRWVNIVAWAPKASMWGKKVTCDSAVFELTAMNLKDTCWSYYYYIYNGPELDSMTDGNFDTLTDYQLYMYYGFYDEDLTLWQQSRVLKYKFPKNGKYLVVGQYYNKCLNQDTVFFQRYNIKCNTNAVTPFIKPEPKLVGVYDIMGRPVAYIRKNEVLIYVYSDGTTRKMIINE